MDKKIKIFIVVSLLIISGFIGTFIFLYTNMVGCPSEYYPDFYFSKDEGNNTLKLIEIDSYVDGYWGEIISQDQECGNKTNMVESFSNLISKKLELGNVIYNCSGKINIAVFPDAILLQQFDFPSNMTNCNETYLIKIIAEAEEEKTPGFELIIFVCALASVLFWKRRKI